MDEITYLGAGRKPTPRNTRGTYSKQDKESSALGQTSTQKESAYIQVAPMLDKCIQQLKYNEYCGWLGIYTACALFHARSSINSRKKKENNSVRKVYKWTKKKCTAQ
jgi:hypothetical protein